MAKIRLIGKVVSDTVVGTIGQNSTKFVKYLVSVSVGGQNNNPRLANANSNTKTSYIGVMAFGKQAEFPIAKGITVELDGEMEISEFQLNQSNKPKKALIVNPQHTCILQGNVQEYAKAYNVLGNFVKNDAEVYTPQREGANTVYSQTLACNKSIGENEYTSFFDIKLFGSRGDKLFAKQLLSKGKVKSLLIDGSVSATYTQKDDKEYFNCSINVADFQIASWANNPQQEQNQNQGTMNNAYTGNAYANPNNQGNAYAEPEVVYEQMNQSGQFDDDMEIPF